MAIQTIDLKVPNGDTPRSANTKINANFSNTSHAASRLVGASVGRIPTSEQIYEVFGTVFSTNVKLTNINEIAAGYGRYWCEGDAVGSPTNMEGVVVTNWRIDYSKSLSTLSGYENQVASGLYSSDVFIRFRQNPGIEWGEWFPFAANKSNYNRTTAEAANVVVDPYGVMRRNTSSERYKNILAPLELDDEHYADAMSVNPIIYRSKAEADNPDYHYYSFSAEQLGAYDPAFTLWRETEAVTDEDGNVTEQPLAERQAEGINLNAIVAFLHATNVKQGKLIESLQDQIDALKPVE